MQDLPADMNQLMDNIEILKKRIEELEDKDKDIFVEHHKALDKLKNYDESD